MGNYFSSVGSFLGRRCKQVFLYLHGIAMQFRHAHTLSRNQSPGKTTKGKQSKHKSNGKTNKFWKHNKILTSALKLISVLNDILQNGSNWFCLEEF